ncbi:hypothetical protein J2S00_001613 [Caldalkalibacillus uzonensis]|uniref:Uncharacterized protein n=1 Tax=Caldalkalibacillus uzonensis TaxID=353224 RepID=A0ABU0CQY0_9BACI|nr:hypothetical protein [Caldalkalibacillus uzonensis]MDQ0338827.1 hypothetical protein [Caldalkalibacillus uzonensis]
MLKITETLHLLIRSWLLKEMMVILRVIYQFVLIVGVYVLGSLVVIFLNSACQEVWWECCFFFWHFGQE